MTQTHQANVDLSQMDLSDWRKRIHQLKQELKANTASPKPSANQSALHGSQPLPRPAGRRVSAT